jgi:hypothetical protein
MDRATLMMAMAAISDRKAIAGEVAKRLNLTTTTLYTSTATGRRRPPASPCSTARIIPARPARHAFGPRPFCNVTPTRLRGVMPRGSGVPTEALSALRRHLVALRTRHPERRALMASTAQLYAVSRATLYRLLRGERRPKDAHRADRGRPRAIPAPEIERWCEIVAAIKGLRRNKRIRMSRSKHE